MFSAKLKTVASDRSVFCRSAAVHGRSRALRMRQTRTCWACPNKSAARVGRPPRYTRPHVPKCPAEEGLRVQMRTDRTAPLAARSCGASSVQDPSAHTHAHAQGEMAAAFNAVPEQISMSGTPMAKTFMAGFQMTHADGGQSPTASNSAHD